MSWEQSLKVGNFSRIMDRLSRLDSSTTLTVHLMNGGAVSGNVLKVDNDEKVVLMKTSPNLPEEISFIPFSSISHLHLLNPAGSLPALTDGEISRNPNQEAPTMLQVKREADETFKGSSPAVTFLFSQELTNIGRLNAQDFIKSLKSSLSLIGADNLGREALGKLSKINVEHSSAGEVSAQMKGSEIILSANYEKLNPASLSKIIKESLEKVL